MIEITNIDEYLKESISNIITDDNSSKQISFIQSKLSNPLLERDYKKAFKSIYTPVLSKASSPIVLIALVAFHQKKGTIIETTFPDESSLLNDPFIATLNPQMSSKDILSDIFNQLCLLCLSDGIHLVNNDKEYFMIQNMSEVLYCISSYRQIQANENEIQDDQENKRNCIQKAICIISTLPLFEYFITHASVAMESYFSQKSLKDKTVILNLYDYLMSRSYDKIEDYQLIKSFNLCSILSFCKDKIFTLIKLIMLEKRIGVYSKIPGNVCGFIFALLSFCSPGGTLFNLNNKGQSFKEVGLPLKLFHSRNIFSPLFTLLDVDNIDKRHSFLVGITNSIILQLKEMKFDCLIDLDHCTITIGKDVHERIILMSKREAIFYDQLKNAIGLQNGGDEKAMQIESNVWLSKQTDQVKENEKIEKIIYHYYLYLFFDISLGIELCQGKITDFEEFIFEKLLVNKCPTERESIENSLAIILSTYNIDFISQWIQTENFYQWYCSVSTRYLSLRSIFYKTISNLTIHYINGDFYSGSLKEGKYNYKGTYYYNDDDQTYFGDWQNNKKHGIGNISNKNHTYLYDGGWSNNQKCGAGYLISNGEKYSGNFLNDVYHGEGELIDQNGVIYKGSFFHGKKCGYGKLIYPNGQEYEGNFEDNNFEGNGILTTPNKIKYIGKFSKGTLEGSVKIELPNKEVYCVIFQNGQVASDGFVTKINSGGRQIDCQLPENLKL